MKMKREDNRSEEMFARLCGGAYYGEFVYRNPKYFEPTEKEAGDVILWVRDWLIIFEIVWRSTDLASDTKSFVKRIGEKRDQLLPDLEIYANDKISIHMKNEVGESTQYDYDCFN